jgi:hypothetical protein
MLRDYIRINELARELEVGAKTIIDYLPEAGVNEKKTHSSSIDLEAAKKVRQYFCKLLKAERAANAKLNGRWIQRTKTQVEHPAKFAALSAPQLRSPAMPAPPTLTQAPVTVPLAPIEIPVEPTSSVQHDRTASKRWAAALGELRRLLMDLLDEVQPRRPRETPAARVSRLCIEDKIPEHIAPLVHTLLKLRNVAEYNSGFVPTKTLTVALGAICAAISEWAKAQGSAYAAEVQDWHPPT